MSFFTFKVLHTSKKSRARVGRIYTPHGVIDTPNFVAVGTNATLKALDSATVDELGLQLMFCNTYHLVLQPGTQPIKHAGGLHKFIGRKQPIITDSGGFQIFSLAYGGVADELKNKGQKKYGNAILHIDEEGVVFRSYRDGSAIKLTPESSVQAQKDLGADIIIPFDELLPYHTDKQTLKKSLERTHRWETRSLQEHQKNPNKQAMYAVIHGGTDNELRATSAQYLTALPFDGFAIGGSLGKDHHQMFSMLEKLIPQLPHEKPTHLLGIGDVPSISDGVKLGIDTFDSSHPTRCARHGLLFTSQGPVKILNSKHKTSLEPIETQCRCLTCKNYSRAYLHHLFKAKEMTGYHVATIHNIHFMVQLMHNIRNKIVEDEL